MNKQGITFLKSMLYGRYILPIVIVFVALSANAQELTSNMVKSGMISVLDEEFDGGGLNSSVWTIRGNQGTATWNRFIYNDPRVTTVKDGALVCRAIKTPDDLTNYTKEMITGAVTSTGKFAFTYGYVEARLKTKQHRANFPAFWLMPENKPNGWYGEIDVWETFNLSNRAYHTVHSEYTLYVDTNTIHQGSEECDYDDWHVLGVLREPDKITFFLDGVATYVYNKSNDATILSQGQWPFDVKYHIILNQSVQNGSNPETNLLDLDFEYETQFDYVHVYQKTNDAVNDGNIECPMNDWNSSTGHCNICGKECKHAETDSEGICTTCGYNCNAEWDDGTGLNKKTGETHNHTWAENGKCEGCGYRCTHDFSTSTTCALCGQEQTVFMKILENIYERTMEDYDYVGASTIDNYFEKLNEDGSFKDIDYNDTRVSGWPSNTHNDRLLYMVAAYSKPDLTFKYRGDDRLYNAIKSVMTFWYTKRPYSQNWYHNQIQWPQYVGLAMCIMRKAPKHLPQDIEQEMLKFYESTNADPSSWTGANKQDIALQWIYRAVLQENMDNLDYAVAQFNQPLAYTTNEGIQHDYSYQQHSNQYYPEGYGKSLLTAFFKTAFYLKDTKYHTAETIEPVSNFMRHCFIPMNRGSYTLYNGVGRGISNSGNLNIRSMRSNYNRMAVLDPEYADFYHDAYTRIDTYTENSSLNLQPLHYHYYRSDYALHQRPGYTMDFRTYSTRTCRAERGNGQGLKNYFLADGGTEIVVDGDEYVDIFPTWDWALIPGTTLPHLTTIPNYGDWGKYGSSTFTGGVSDGKYGFATYHYDDQKAEVVTSAYKSVFFFDNEVVCLGTNINSANSAEINTTVNQCLLKTAVTYSTSDSENTIHTLNEKGEHDFANLRWLNQGKVSYYFPDDATIRVTNKTQSGNWSAINWNVNKTEEKEVFTAFINHGVQPANKAYTYYILPNTQNIASAQSALDDIEVVNTNDVQAVYNKSLGILQIVFHTATPLEIDGMRIYPKSRCAMMLTGIGTNAVKAYISDPSYSQPNIIVTMSVRGEGTTMFRKIWAPTLPTTPDYCGMTIESPISTMTDCEGDDCKHVSYSNGFCNICHIPQAAPLNEDGVYEISNAGQLAWLAEQVNALSATEVFTSNVILVNDIDFGNTKYNWQGIGHWTSDSDYNGFAGTFDGQGHEIRNFYMVPKTDYSGLFNCVCGAIIKNFTISGEMDLTSSHQYIGTIVGMSNYNSSYNSGLNSRSIVQDVHSKVNINISEASMCKYVGGIAGKIAKYNDWIYRCRYSGTINASDSYNSIAGIVANANSSTISNCLFDGHIICTSTEKGGSGVVVAGILGTVTGGRNIYVLNCLSNGKFDIASNTNGNSGIVCGYMNIQNGENVYYFDLNGTQYSSSGVNVANGNMNAVGYRTVYAGLINDANHVSEEDLHSGSVLGLLGIKNWTQNNFTDGYPIPSASGFNCTHQYGITDDNLCHVCRTLLPSDDGICHIKTASAFCSFRNAVNEGNYTYHTVLDNDIELTGIFSDPIGDSWEHAFKGVFDGQGHSITGLNMKSPSIKNLALFGFVGDAECDPVIKNFSISGTIEYTGTGAMNSGVVANIQSGTLSCIHSQLDIKRTGTNSNDSHIGGILGNVDWSYRPVEAHPVIVDRCWFSGTIESNAYGSAAGIVANANRYVTISNCLMTGTISNTYSGTENCQVGGILGYIAWINEFGGIQNCLYAGTITQPNMEAANVYVASIAARDRGEKKKYANDYACPADGANIPGIAFDPNTPSKFTLNTLTPEQLVDGSAVPLLGEAWRQVVGVDACPIPLPDWAQNSSPDGTIKFKASNDNTNYWATFSSTDNVVLPLKIIEGKDMVELTVYYVNADNEGFTIASLEEDLKSNDGWHLPANNGYLLKSESTKASEHSYTYTIGDSQTFNGISSDKLTSNMLMPASVPMSDDNYNYKLSTYNGANVGFYWGAENGGVFTMKNSNGAYLAVPKSINAAKFISLDNLSTAIAKASTQPNANAPIYNIAGQRVSPNTKGIIIQNGKKYFNK